MNIERYKEVDDSGKGLTKEELDQGWHFCYEWDGLLVGPGSDEALVCSCDIPGIEQWKKTKEAMDKLAEMNDESMNTNKKDVAQELRQETKRTDLPHSTITLLSEAYAEIVALENRLKISERGMNPTKPELDIVEQLRLSPMLFKRDKLEQWTFDYALTSKTMNDTTVDLMKKAADEIEQLRKERDSLYNRLSVMGERWETDWENDKVKIQKLEKERDDLFSRVKDIQEGFEGCCHACEPVGLKNKQLLELLREVQDDHVALMENFDDLTKTVERLKGIH